MADTAEDQVDPVEELAEEFLVRLRRGERPALDEYVKRHPQWAEQIRELFPTLLWMEQLKSTTIVGDAKRLAPGEKSGRLLGDFRVVREVGRGGMGIVYEAVQESLGRRVALKVLSGVRIGDAMAIERFRREARAVAGMHHTNIVGVLGVGEEDGLCYYAMQFIEGKSLETTIDELRLPLQSSPDEDDESADALAARADQKRDRCRQAARIGSQIARALAYAHAHGILHRDIKPANLLIDHEGTAWVADFGLAKTEGIDELTKTGDVLGTVRYMAPERFQGRSLPESDVYSLGLSLYELITLDLAYGNRDPASLLDAILHEAPAAALQNDPTVPRDLAMIVAKSTALASRDRYRSAQELADDLDRFIAGEPVRARPLGRIELAVRWCQRNPYLAGALSAIGVVAAAGFLGIFWEWRQAERHRVKAEENFVQARTAVDEFLTMVSENKLLDVPGAQPLRKDLLESALRYYQRFAEQRADDPSIRAELAQTLFRVGVLNQLLGRTSAAVEAFERAAHLQEANRQAFAQVRKHRSDLVRTYIRLGELQRRPMLALAQSSQSIASALQISESLVAEEPESWDYQRDLARVYWTRSMLLDDLGRFDDAEQSIRRAEEVQRWILSKSKSEEDRFDLGRILWKKAATAKQRNQGKGALEAASDAVAIFRRLHADNPSAIAYQKELALSLGELTIAQYKVQDVANATSSAAESRELIRTLCKQNPQVIEYRLYLTQAEGFNAAASFLSGDLRKGMEDFKQSTAVLRDLISQKPDDPYLLLMMIYLYQSLSLTRPDFAPPPVTYTQGIEALNKILAIPPGNPGYWALRGACHAQLGDWKSAERDYSQSVDLDGKEWIDYLRLALLRLSLDDRDGYRSLCRGLMRRIKEEPDDAALQIACSTAMLQEGAIDDFKLLVGATQKQARAKPLSFLDALTHGGILYRAGRREESIHELQRADSLLAAMGLATTMLEREMLLCRSIAQLLLASAFLDAGAVDRAKFHLAQSDRFLNRVEEQSDADRSRLRAAPWEVRLFASVLRREACSVRERLGKKP